MQPKRGTRNAPPVNIQPNEPQYTFQRNQVVTIDGENKLIFLVVSGFNFIFKRVKKYKYM